MFAKWSQCTNLFYSDNVNHTTVQLDRVGSVNRKSIGTRQQRADKEMTEYSME